MKSHDKIWRYRVLHAHVEHWKSRRLELYLEGFISRNNFGDSFLPLSTVCIFLPYPYPTSYKMNEKCNTSGNFVPMLVFVSFTRYRRFHKIAQPDY